MRGARTGCLAIWKQGNFGLLEKSGNYRETLVRVSIFPGKIRGKIIILPLFLAIESTLKRGNSREKERGTVDSLGEGGGKSSP